MRRSCWLVAALAAVLVAPSVTRAGLPFGGDDPGCVPDGTTAAKCAAAAGKALARLFGAVVACHAKLADAAFNHTTFDEEACEQTDGTSSAHARFKASLAKLAAPCADTPILSAADAIATALLADAPAAGSLDTLATAVYCDPTSGVALDPGGDDLGFVPASKDGLACASAVGKGLAKLAGAVLSCHRKAAASGLKGGSTDDEPCEATARAKFDAVTAKLVGKEGCPACLRGRSQSGVSPADAIVALAEEASERLYPCPGTTTTTTTTTLASSSTTSSSTSSSSPSSTSTTIAGCTAATTHRPFSVSFAVPDSSVIVQGLTLLIDYPEAQVTIPGSGNATSVRQSIINVQSGALSQPFDLDVALREQIAGTANPLTPGHLFTINFLDCQGATPPTPADFTCTVEVATDPLGLADQGVTCAVSAG